MQVYIAKTLNKVLVLFCVLIALLFALIFAAYYFFPALMRWQLLIFVCASVFLALYYRYLEEYADKRFVTKMAQQGNIALMHIQSGKRLAAVRDTSFRQYWIYQLNGTLYTQRGETLEKNFTEKMSKASSEIPSGFVYVCYSQKNPEQLLIVPNAIISSLPRLAPIVGEYERNKALHITYLDAHYNKGMVLQTFRAAMADYKKERA